jgi:glycosyltransferase involved in cell wall biosynthesis
MKQLCIVSCPIDTYSGYGARARDFFKALYEAKKDEYDFKILSQRWGATPWGYIMEEWSWVLPMIHHTPELPKKPDVWIQITVPNEFQPIGVYNIGLTAGVETTACDAAWIEGVNRMDLTLVSSEHAKTVFEQTAYQKKDKHTNQTVEDIRLQKPVKVLFEGVDLDKYFFLEDSDIEETDLVKELDEIEEDFCFLFVGHWLQGDLGEDRKNVGLMLKTFLETFKDKKNQPALIMKVSGAGSSIMDRDMLLKKIDGIRESVKGKLPNVYLLHGELDDKDINYLYNHGKVKAMFNLTKGEGFGRPLLEFSLAKKPIIVSGWSGHTDFLDREFTCQIGGSLRDTHPSAHVSGIILPDAKWFSPDLNQAKHYLKSVYEKYTKYQELAKRQAKKSREEFSYDKMKEAIKIYFNNIPKSTQPQLQLPKLKKIELPKLNKL